MEDENLPGNSGQIDVRLTRIEADNEVTVNLAGSELEGIVAITGVYQQGYADSNSHGDGQ